MHSDAVMFRYIPFGRAVAIVQIIILRFSYKVHNKGACVCACGCACACACMRVCECMQNVFLRLFVCFHLWRDVNTINNISFFKLSSIFHRNTYSTVWNSFLHACHLHTFIGFVFLVGLLTILLPNVVNSLGIVHNYRHL